MSAPYVRAFYGVTFKRGDHVKVDGRRGVIVSFPDQYLGVRFDGEKRTSRCHPTWRVELDSGLSLADLLALPDGSRFIDRFADVGTIRAGVVTYPETADMSAERAVKKYSPLRLIATPDPDVCESFGCDGAGYSHQGTSYSRGVEEKQYAPCGRPCERGDDGSTTVAGPVPSSLPEGTCLQCGEARAEVNETKVICGTLDRDGELAGGRHRRAMWSDRGVAFLRPEESEAYRRASLFALDNAPNEHRGLTGGGSQ